MYQFLQRCWLRHRIWLAFHSLALANISNGFHQAEEFRRQSGQVPVPVAALDAGLSSRAASAELLQQAAAAEPSAQQAEPAGASALAEAADAAGLQQGAAAQPLQQAALQQQRQQQQRQLLQQQQLLLQQQPLQQQVPPLQQLRLHPQKPEPRRAQAAAAALPAQLPPSRPLSEFLSSTDAAQQHSGEEAFRVLCQVGSIRPSTVFQLSSRNLCLPLIAQEPERAGGGIQLMLHLKRHVISGFFTSPLL